MNYGTFIFACVALFVCFFSLSLQVPLNKEKMDPPRRISVPTAITEMEPQTLARYVRKVVDDLSLLDPKSLKGLLSAQTGFNSKQIDAIMDELEKDL